MKIELLPSTVGDAAARQFCMSVLINDTIALDAGALGLLWPVERQHRVQNVFLSHSHADHIATLPLFLDNVYQSGPKCPTIHSCPSTEATLRKDVFNGRVWPDFIQLSQVESPFLELRTLKPHTPVQVSDVTITATPLKHVVPTMGFVVEQKDSAVAFLSDTNSTDRISDVLQNTANLRAVFLECSFPNSQHALADKTGHLCPQTFATYAQLTPDTAELFAWHLKPGFYDEIASELAGSGAKIAKPGHPYHF